MSSDEEEDTQVETESEFKFFQDHITNAQAANIELLQWTEIVFRIITGKDDLKESKVDPFAKA